MAKELKIVEVGLDLGNYGANIANRNQKGDIKVAKIPVAHSLEQPQGRLNDQGQRMNVRAFDLTIDGVDYWFGEDILNLGDAGVDCHYMDEEKYDHPEYLRRIAIASLHNWSVKNRIELQTTGVIYRLNVSMPPEDYADSAKRKVAQRAYRSAFDTDKRVYLKAGSKPAKQINIKLGSLLGEATSYLKTHRNKHGDVNTLIVDYGGGTEDRALYLEGQNKPYAVNSFKHTGLVHAYESSGGDRKEVERNVLEGGVWPRGLVNHMRKLRNDLKTIKRRLNGHYFRHLVIMGGGASLIRTSKPQSTKFKALADKVFILDEYVTAKSNLENAEAKAKAK